PWAGARDWVEDANTAGLLEPTAMNLATVDAQGQPSNRTVLFKGWKDNFPTFFTNYDGRKGQELLSRPKAALCFWWDRLDRQIRFEGEARALSDTDNDRYFASRSRGSQIGAWASDQSRPVNSREDMESRYAAFARRFGDVQPIPRPPHWGGFVLIPHAVEIWQGQANRFHDRITYTRDSEDHWHVQRLQP
ncbi:MAG: pyridoxamine 5'-phosphate oxidase, partial [Oceanococcaceae bacterium]